MKLLSLNVWGGAVGDPLLEFVARHAATVDIFCFQEVYAFASIDSGHEDAIPNLLGKLQHLLPDHESSFAGAHTTDGRRSWGNVTFVRRDIPVIEHRDLYGDHELTVPEEFGWVPYCGLYTHFKHGSQDYHLVNLHGLWAKDTHKRDILPRLEQSRHIKEFLQNKGGSQVIVGDFNLLPDTESLALLSEGMIDHIKENDVTSTRSELYLKPLKLADYLLTSPDIRVTEFMVLPDQVSDHLALMASWN